MVRHNNMIGNQHFHKDWQRYVKTWFDQPFKKQKRRLARDKKAASIAPLPAKGPLRPIVHCPTFRYNLKTRLGYGFSLQELKAARINKHFARTIGISVDYRRRNKSVESVQLNRQRLKEYMSKLILKPKNPKQGKVDDFNDMQQLQGKVMPIPRPKMRIKAKKVDELSQICVYQVLRQARAAQKKTKGQKKTTSDLVI